ncbi:10264_t:CDS:2 [Paraglomus brasilianum]|uniref:10264_t:CDS:1 n=1 Tax=Paraglomus brasilianum TaxID=144538 RepID=A0A9N9DAK6_9GLOM|nr:10264_t:CDS:2 [Paraglomus brasilianum]
MTVEEYNRLYVSRQLPIFDKIEKLYDKFSGCQNDIPLTDKERLEELKKSETISATGNDTKKPLNDPLKDQDRGELGKRANEIEAYRKKAKQEIETALNQDPKITNEELEMANRN